MELGKAACSTNKNQGKGENYLRSAREQGEDIEELKMEIRRQFSQLPNLPKGLLSV
jgi:hypothetical protein